MKLYFHNHFQQGGEMLGSFPIYHELFTYFCEKPIVVLCTFIVDAVDENTHIHSELYS